MLIALIHKDIPILLQKKFDERYRKSCSREISFFSFITKKSYSNISINCFFPRRSILFVKELSLNNTSIYQSDKSSLTLQPFLINLGFVSVLIETQIDIRSRILKKGKSEI